MKTFRLLSLTLVLLAFMMLQEMCKKKDGTPQVVAVLSISPTSGTLTTVFTFDGSSSHDGNNSTAGLMYRWDADSDGIWDIDWTVNSIIDVTFSAAGTFLVTMEVKSTPDNTATDSKQVTVTGGGGGQLPTVTTTAASNITQSTASSGGNVTSQGSSAVEYRGVCYSTSQNPTINDELTDNGNGTGNFTSQLSGLVPGTTYFIRAYASNNEGVAYGNQVNFTTLGGGSGCPPNMTDPRDGQIYQTVLIGDQCWMRENLNVGTRINGNQTQTNNGTIEKYCYNDNPGNCDTYGGFYQWDEMMTYTTTEGAQGICPAGWHIPTYEEYRLLAVFLGGSGIAGGKMKVSGTTFWNSPNVGATNESGFSGLGTGWRSFNTFFGQQGEVTGLWTSTQNQSSSNYAKYKILRFDNDDLASGDFWKGSGWSIRCLMD